MLVRLVEVIKTYLQFMILCAHMEAALLLLLRFLFIFLSSGAWDGPSWSGREQRGLFIRATVS